MNRLPEIVACRYQKRRLRKIGALGYLFLLAQIVSQILGLDPEPDQLLEGLVRLDSKRTDDAGEY